MRIFISSVRKGLEEERDALPGLISALGHTPVQFEDFTAQSTPSREVCLRALHSADVCLFLLGPNYGHTFPETGQSATHDEWVAAQVTGMPRLVYRKLGVTFEPDQHEFTRTVEAYATGVFRDDFRTTAELQRKIVAKIKELESGPSPLAYAKLTAPPALHWSLDEDTPSGTSDPTPRLELHVAPVSFAGYSARELAEFTTSLAERIRRTGTVRNDAALSTTRSQEYAAVTIPTSAPPGQPQQWNAPHPGQLVEVRLFKAGQISTRATLPGDSMGSVLDPEALPRQIASMLKLTGALDIIRQERIVVAAGVSNPARTTVETFNPHQARQSVQMAGFGRSLPALRTEPDESVSLAALAAGAQEVASVLARALITQHPSSA
ncbi:DUF4062 domain-containing protein [Streptomyces lincolnensis]|uniref:DUF4062 domain-containing protein n=1 Tax=Streptomyces lincolnensis TaxID=1915 RepID=UPI001E534E21|nr:DUF4062 domain-containing protein [Streptomyces lincolnensis]MCD7444742.1 DUF4062 domain-containing protein [Streptomyces lincolnensis]